MKTNTELYEFLSTIVGSVPYGIIAVDLEGTVVMINNQALSILNLEGNIDDYLDISLYSLFQKRYATFIKKVKNCLVAGRKAFFISELKNGDKYTSIYGSPILNGMLFTFLDASQQVQNRKEAKAALIKGQEQERFRIAKELHDGMGPTFSTIRLHWESLSNLIVDDTEVIAKRKHIIDDLLSNVSKDLRSVSHRLLPSALKDFGLMYAVEELCQRITSAGGIEVHFQQDSNFPRILEDVELSLYRIIQELINNSLKHSQASCIEVGLEQEKSQIQLLFQDDGTGFDQSKKLRNGIGFQNIKSRVEVLNGKFNVQSAPNTGFQASVLIPLRKQQLTKLK